MAERKWHIEIWSKGGCAACGLSEREPGTNFACIQCWVSISSLEKNELMDACESCGQSKERPLSLPRLVTVRRGSLVYMALRSPDDSLEPGETWEKCEGLC